MSNAPDAEVEQQCFRVTHPFHPLFEREFDLVHHRQCWGEDRVFFLDEGDEVRSFPARWTSVVANDSFVIISAGRSLFRVSDLLELAKMMLGAGR